MPFMEVKLKAALSLASKLASPVLELRKQAVCDIRLLSKLDDENRRALAQAGAVPLLLKLLCSSDSKIQENAVTALLNLSICSDIKETIMQTPASLDFILISLSAGKTMETKQNTAALLFSLMVAEHNRPLIGGKPGFVQALFDLVRTGSTRGVKDGLKALFHVVLCDENRPIVVAAGGIPLLLSVLSSSKSLSDSKSGLLEDSLAVLAQTLGCPESIEPCRKASAIPTLIDFLENGSPRCQENAASALLNHCRSGGEEVVSDVKQSGSCVSSLHTLLSKGSSRGKAKASALLQLLVVG